VLVNGDGDFFGSDIVIHSKGKIKMQVIKPCEWCNSPMITTRSSKRLCSTKCHSAFHRWRIKHFPGLGPEQGFKMLKIEKEEKQND